VADIRNYLNELDDLLQDAKGVPFSGKVSVNKEEIEDIIDAIRDAIPTEIKKAQDIVEQYESYIENAKVKANDIIENAHREANELKSEHRIFKLAQEAADKQAEEAKHYSREMRIGTMNYVDGVLSKTEDTVREALEDVHNGYRLLEKDLMETINRLYENKQEIRGGGDE